MQNTDSMAEVTGTQKKHAHIKDVHIELLAGRDGTEILRYTLPAGQQWTLIPETGVKELQYCFVISGFLRWTSKTGRGILRPGDSMGANPITDYIELHADVDSEFLIVYSRPVFHLYSVSLKEIKALAVSVEEKDGYTAEHCNRIRSMSVKVAEIMNLTPDQRFDVRIGSFLHDVGKVRVPDKILNKPGALTADEWRIMREHPIHGREMMNDLKQARLKGASRVVEQHHERFDGSGYPYGLKGNEIHIGAAIVAVVDSYDAMTSNRVYRKARPVADAADEIRQLRGKIYHPDVVDAFLSLSL